MRAFVAALTGKMNAGGALDWTPPPGRWTIQRIGCTSTGETNNSAGAGAGLECDKFNPAAARIQFDGWFGAALDRVGPELSGKTLWRNHTDSWEAFSQNWSPVFRDEFIRRRGYDPLPWLPAMSGVPVGSADESERFLHHIRRTIADLVCDNFYAPLTRAGRERGAAFSAECIAPTMMADGLQHFQYADLPMGEFWLNSVNQDKPNDIQDAISGGHIYGRRVIGAEAFTQNPLRWNTDPYHLKPMGDYNFARGINQFVLHVWAHQAFDRRPGVTLNAVGTFFSGAQTWHKPGKAWFDYLRRCSALLQQGLPVADACYFIGEEQPARSFLRRDLPAPLPDGYAYDCINRDALLTRAAAKDGRLVLPDGVSYRLLVLPPADRMTPEVAENIGELAAAGVPVIGPPPTRSISLTGYPDCDAQVRRIVGASWKPVRSRATTRAVFEDLGLPPDVEFLGADMTPVYREQMEYSSPPFAWNHRRTGKAEIYFLSSQERRPRSVEVAFRVAGRLPELWDAATGSTRDACAWREEEGRTIVPVRFAPAGSVFVVFRRSAAGVDPVVRITPGQAGPPSGLPPMWIENGRAWVSEAGAWRLTRRSGKSSRVAVDRLPAPYPLTTPWSVRFPPGRGAPDRIALTALRSLSEHEDPGVRHFSGTAAYSCTFKRAEGKEDDRLFLDLGRVANLAGVTVNGRNLGVLWKPPFVVEVTGALKPGANTLAVDVTNTWRNRLIGDAGLPAARRTTWRWRPDDRLLEPMGDLDPAGLIGPAVLRTVRGIAID